LNCASESGKESLKFFLPINFASRQSIFHIVRTGTTQFSFGRTNSMKLLLPFFLTAFLIGIQTAASAEVSDSPRAEVVSGSAGQAIGSEVAEERLAENFSDADGIDC
jgi:hypothetical protein